MNFFQSDVSLITGLGYSILGMAIVFAVLIILIGVVKLIELFTNRGTAAAEEPAPAASNPAAIPAPVPVRPAPGTAGELNYHRLLCKTARAYFVSVIEEELIRVCCKNNIHARIYFVK